MQAADRNIVIDKGVDFTIRLKVTEGIGSPKDLVGYTPKMKLMKTDSNGNVLYASENAVEFTSIPAYIVNGVLLSDGVDDSGNQLPAGQGGKFEIIIDAAVTSVIDTNLPIYLNGIGEPLNSNNPFATEYTYFYSIDLIQNGGGVNKEDLRILRGKCAVRI